MSSPLRSVRPQPSCDNQVSHNLAWDKPGIYNPTTCHQTRCSCSCGCACCNNGNKDDENILETASSPPRGRSLTPKFDRTNGNNRPIPISQTTSLEPPSYPTAIPSFNSQEGLATNQIEQQQQQHTPLGINDLDTHAHASIQHWLEHHHSQTHPYGFYFADSPEASVLVEASTMAPSVASSGFLPPRVVASAADLLSFATGGFDGGAGEVVMEGKTCAFTPLWLTHERRYCRGAQVEGGGGAAAGYPAAVDLFGVE